MKILVYGAGVLGCNLARNLLRAGKDVTLLARGNWAAEIKQNGLRIKDKFSPRTSVSRIPVVTELAPGSCPMVIFFRSMETTRSDSRCPAESAKANRTFFSGSAAASALACTLLPTKTMFFVRFARSVYRTESSCV